MREILLASTSPRRQMLLRQVGLPFVVLAPQAQEQHPTNGDFETVVVKNALAKARSVAAYSSGRLILGADTVVDVDGRAMGKPRDKGEARQMLKTLSDRDHFVHTGFALIDEEDGVTVCESVTTRVWFRCLTDSEIKNYIASGEPMDKAGAYGIQGRGALFIKRIEGCFFNVMGLPLARLWEQLHAIKFFR